MAMTLPTALAVYCGSKSGDDPRYRSDAVRFGRLMAQAGVALVYGGGSIGIMGAVADAVLQGGGRVIGVIPQFLQRAEVQHLALTEQHVVETMHERKLMMFERADGFVVLPGGIGTLEEFFEVLSWRGLELHDKPIIVVDGAGYWQPLRDLLDHTIAQGFTDRRYADFVHFVDGIDAVIPAFDALPKGAVKADLDDRI
jgi:uncharacterized protein (TIGR00730 family)